MDQIELNETGSDLAPRNDTITLQALTEDPYPIYRQLRAQAPVVRVSSLKRTLLTRAADTRFVKETPDLFSSDDPDTPMKRAFRAHTLMRKDGAAHLRERMAMAPAFAPRVIRKSWVPIYQRIAEDYVARLPRGEMVDLFPALAGPYAAAGLAHLLGIPSASDDDMQRWSQALIDGAGNFAWLDAPFAASDQANDEMDALLLARAEELRASPDDSALSAMVNAEDPIEWSQIVSNIKIAIGGGLNEPRDSFLTAVAGLLEHPDQLDQVRRNQDWSRAFEEAIRWVAPIQVSSRLVMQDTEIRGCLIPKGDTVMTSQASANRDEEIWPDGEEFNAYRDQKSHQAFGNGPHFCQGTHVARKAVAELMLPLLFDRFPDLSIAPGQDILWKGFGFRGPVKLPVLLA